MYLCLVRLNGLFLHFCGRCDILLQVDYCTENFPETKSDVAHFLFNCLTEVSEETLRTALADFTVCHYEEVIPDLVSLHFFTLSQLKPIIFQSGFYFNLIIISNIMT